jgi:2-pyrone-4,6-dicarboxylate lactonase
MDEHPNVWSKVTCPDRLSVTGPPYDDVVPFARRVIERYPDRVLTGTDWPHPNLKTHMPDDGDSSTSYRACHHEELQRKLLVDNPLTLYWREYT